MNILVGEGAGLGAPCKEIVPPVGRPWRGLAKPAGISADFTILMWCRIEERGGSGWHRTACDFLTVYAAPSGFYRNHFNYLILKVLSHWTERRIAVPAPALASLPTAVVFAKQCATN